MNEERLQSAADLAALERAQRAGEVLTEKVRAAEQAVQEAKEAELLFWRERASVEHLLSVED